MLNLRSLLLGIGLVLVARGVWADTLKMPAPVPVQPAAKAQAKQTKQAKGPTHRNAPEKKFSVKMPRRGMTMKAVEKEFGPPLKKLPQVGDPPHQPIVRWIYKDYTVYFEYKYVIDSVLNTVPVKP